MLPESMGEWAVQNALGPQQPEPWAQCRSLDIHQTSGFMKTHSVVTKDASTGFQVVVPMA